MDQKKINIKINNYILQLSYFYAPNNKKYLIRGNYPKQVNQVNKTMYYTKINDIPFIS